MDIVELCTEITRKMKEKGKWMRRTELDKLKEYRLRPVYLDIFNKRMFRCHTNYNKRSSA
jgi:hypothetical protein